MCGITAISRASERSSIQDPRRFLRLAAMAIEERGRDATGFGWVRSSGKSFYWKSPGKASFAAHHAPLDVDIDTAIAHTRYKTQGDVKNNENNHPVVDDGIMLVHNGVIKNEKALYALLGKDFVPLAEVDSQVAATLLAHLHEIPSADHATDLLSLISGDAAFAWIQTDDPNALHLARLSGRPMTLGWTRRGDLVMSSTPGTLERLSFAANLRLRSIMEVPEGTYLRVVGGVIVETRAFKVLPPPPPKTYTKYTPKTVVLGKAPKNPGKGKAAKATSDSVGVTDAVLAQEQAEWDHWMAGGPDPDHDRGDYGSAWEGMTDPQWVAGYKASNGEWIQGYYVDLGDMITDDLIDAEQELLNRAGEGYERLLGAVADGLPIGSESFDTDSVAWPI